MNKQKSIFPHWHISKFGIISSGGWIKDDPDRDQSSRMKAYRKQRRNKVRFKRKFARTYNCKKGK